MNKKLLFLPIALLFFNLKGQVGIGTNDFSTSEAVKIESSKGHKMKCTKERERKKPTKTA
ncbi:hypothetical protein [Ornithobacterium rhinotracheale]